VAAGVAPASRFLAVAPAFHVYVSCRFQLHPRREIAFIRAEPTNSQPGTLPPALVKKK
jgi:hypothetical protein